MKKIKLGEILDVKRGTSLSGEFYAEQGERIRLTLGNFNYPAGGFKQNVSKINIYFTGEVKQEFILKKGDIITPLTEQVSGLLGETARIPEDNKYIQSGDIGLVIPYENRVDNSFVYYLISSPVVKKQLDAAAQQTKIRHTSPEKIKDCEVWLPDIKYQKSAGILLDVINKKIECNNKIIAELESMAKTIYDYWFLQFEFPNEEGKPYKSSGGKMVWNEELKREIPEEWANGTLEDLGEIVAGGTPSTNHPEYYSENGIAWITPNDLSNSNDKYITHGERDISEIGMNNSSARLMPEGTVLLTSRAPIGYLGIAANEVCTNQGFKSIVPNGKFGSEFIYYTVEKMIGYLKSLGTGSTFTEISKAVVAKVKIVIPEELIVKRFEEMVLDICAKRKIIENENKELIALRDFLLPLLMNGQVSFKSSYIEKNENL